MPSKKTFLIFLFCTLLTTVALGQDSIDGIWYGVYTSTSSPNPTQEVLIFNSVGNEVVGAYLSHGGAAGVLDGIGSGRSYALQVTQPTSKCPSPYVGIFHAQIAGDEMIYTFQAHGCTGTDVGSGKARRAAGELVPASTPLDGFWRGIYISTDSPQPTDEILYFQAFGKKTTGIYVSESGASGILTGSVVSDHFTLHDTSPSPPCPSEGTFGGRLASPMDLIYSFYGTDCHGVADQGRGQGKKFVP